MTSIMGAPGVLVDVWPYRQILYHPSDIILKPQRFVRWLQTLERLSRREFRDIFRENVPLPFGQESEVLNVTRYWSINGNIAAKLIYAVCPSFYSQKECACPTLRGYTWKVTTFSETYGDRWLVGLKTYTPSGEVNQIFEERPLTQFMESFQTVGANLR